MVNIDHLSIPTPVSVFPTTGETHDQQEQDEQDIQHLIFLLKDNLMDKKERDIIKEHNKAIAYAGSFYWQRGGLTDLKIAEKIMEANLMALDQIGEPTDIPARQQLEQILVAIRKDIAAGARVH